MSRCHDDDDDDDDDNDDDDDDDKSSSLKHALRLAPYNVDLTYLLNVKCRRNKFRKLTNAQIQLKGGHTKERVNDHEDDDDDDDDEEEEEEEKEEEEEEEEEE
ncbi:hypothetical protein HZH66_014498 [Vespula vulgaris]|uniref:Uncharacterized protein n=1 Tax=Vespula vulgaris TaxID=7454 RepID=A0A834J0U5_VESVU|nr:hypothetical protein HZH66_014498 [Vespula vulgaris]